MTKFLDATAQEALYNHIVHRADDQSEAMKLELKARLAVMPQMTFEKVIAKVVTELNISLN
jgi:hypothetical protein